MAGVLGKRVNWSGVKNEQGRGSDTSLLCILHKKNIRTLAPGPGERFFLFLRLRVIFVQIAQSQLAGANS